MRLAATLRYPGLWIALTLATMLSAGRAGAQTPAVVGATSPGVTIGPAHPVVSVPVTISRDDTAAVLGFSIQIALSPEFAALDVNNDVALGNFLTDGGRSANLQVVANGGGLYTIDGTVAGVDCGPTAPTGTLFTVALRSSVPSGTGTVTIQSVTVNDCASQPLATNPGSAASVDIDNTAPSVSVLAPNGGETWVHQTSHAVTWSASDAAGVSGVNLDYSTDGGSNWTPIATGEANDGTYSWSIPNTPTATALVRVTAQDVNGNVASDTSDAVFTLLSNTAPVLDAIGDRILDEGTPLAFTATAVDGESPPQALTFSLVGEPAGAAIESSTGAFSWTPSEAQGPADHTFTVKVSDDGSPPMSDEEEITVTVHEVNVAPLLTDVPASATIPEQAPYSFDATASDSDLPAQTLRFSLIGEPAGAVIDSVTGVFGWTPSEAQGPGDYPFTVRVTDGVTNTNAPIALHVDDVTVAALADLSAIATRTGNDDDGTTKVQLNWTATPGGTTVEVFRARFGGYPEYDDGGGVSPPVPSYPPASPWESVPSVTTPGQTDEVNGIGARDYWSYIAFVHGPGLNLSGPSNVAATPNYLLGDVSNGLVTGRGNNAVGGEDLSLLGANYGLSGLAVGLVNYLDVGPTSDFTVNGRPLTDNEINFEDFVLFAINFGSGPAPQALVTPRSPVPASGAVDRLVVETPEQVTAGEEYAVRLHLQGSGSIQALSAALAWEPDRAEPLRVEAGEWLLRENGLALSPRPGVADLALLGARETGLAGEGVIAIVRFRALATGAPSVILASVQARDAANQPIDLAVSNAPEPTAVPAFTRLSGASPNPFRGSTTIAFSMAEAGPVSIRVFGVDGRRVRTLTDGLRQPGTWRIAWDGRDEQGRAVSAGIYFVRMATRHGQFTKIITHLR